MKLDVPAGAAIIVTAALAVAGALGFPAAGGAVPGPAMFPIAIAALWAGFGVVLLVSGWRRVAVATEEPPAWRGMAGLFGLTAGYAVLMPWLGFIATSALFLTLAVRFLGYRHWWRAGAVALATSFVVFWLFAGLMKVPLPAGWLG